MAKDGTNRGGRRVRAGDKPSPAAEKKQKGLPVKIISNDIPALDTAELEAVDLPEGAVLNGSDMPKPSDYLSALTIYTEKPGCGLSKGTARTS